LLVNRKEVDSATGGRPHLPPDNQHVDAEQGNVLGDPFFQSIFGIETFLRQRDKPTILDAPKKHVERHSRRLRVRSLRPMVAG
jgi:hypothetical protein